MTTEKIIKDIEAKLYFIETLIKLELISEGYHELRALSHSYYLIQQERQKELYRQSIKDKLFQVFKLI